MKKVAIIGAGIIGLYLSVELSKKGFDVCVFEKASRKEVGKKSCSTLVSQRFLNFIPLGKSFIENEINECHINFKKKKVVLKFNPAHLVLDREKVVEYLIEETSAKIFFEHEIKDIPKDFDYVIGADGFNSIIGRKIGKPNLNQKVGYQVFSDKENWENKVETFKTKTGFAWIIPRGVKTEYGILEKPENLKEEWANFNKHGNNPRFASVPQGLYLPFTDKCVLCGDSTGLVKPWSGGGLIWQLYEANILLNTFPNFKQYKKEVEKKFKFMIFKGKISNFMVHFVGKNLSFLLPNQLKYDNDFPSIIDTIFKK